MHLRVLLTSRPEWPILQEFSEITSHEHKDPILHEDPKPVMQHNITSFLESRLSKIRKERSLPIDWPKKKNIQLVNLYTSQVVSIRIVYINAICELMKGEIRLNWL